MIHYINQVLAAASGKLAGLESLLWGPYSWTGLIYFLILAAAVVFSHCRGSTSEDRRLFWVLGLLLICFTVARPMTLSRDDAAYIDIGRGVCAIFECQSLVQVGRDWVWYNLVGLLRSAVESSQAILLLAGLGVLIKLWVIDQLCRQRLSALLLLLPLIYIQYDFTQLRAGFALSWFFMAIFLLSRQRLIAASGLLLTNFLVHAQAIFSPGILCYKLFERRILAVWLSMLGLVLLIYSGWFPSRSVIELLGVSKFASSYYQELLSGGYAGVKVFPAGYLLILAYAAWLSLALRKAQANLVAIVTASFTVGLGVAWFFSVIPTMQCRIFEFYCAPLVLLAGNMGASRLKMWGTVILAAILYLRLELLHDWILG